MNGRYLASLWILLMVASGCGSETTPPATSIVGKASAEGGSKGAISAAGAAATVIRGQETPQDPNRPVLAIETSEGVIEVELDRERAPLTVYHILDLATSGHFRDTLVHFVAEGRMIVCGGYNVDREPCAPAAPVRNEADNGLKNVRGTIAMSRPPDAIDGGTCTFFINLADAPEFDHHGQQPEDFGYCVFGHVVQGLETVERIAAAATIPGEFGDQTISTPATPIVIKDVRIIR